MSEVKLGLGSVIRGTYTVERYLGAGAFGRVYLVRHRIFGHQALKLFRRLAPHGGLNATVEEALILSRLLNRHIVRVFEANYIEGPNEVPYMTMEYISGGTLAGLLDERVRLAPETALDVARQVCLGLSAAHAARPPIVHRDVKPQNILLEPPIDGRFEVKIGDFGLAKHVDADSRMAAAAGTLCYLAPESAWGYHTPASDVYSLGVVTYQMLTGILPFPLDPTADTGTAAGARDALRLSRKRPAVAPSGYRLGLSDAVDRVVMKALAANPGDRYPDAAALHLALIALPELAALLPTTTS